MWKLWTLSFSFSLLCDQVSSLNLGSTTHNCADEIARVILSFQQKLVIFKLALSKSKKLYQNIFIIFLPAILQC